MCLSLCDCVCLWTVFTCTVCVCLTCPGAGASSARWRCVRAACANTPRWRRPKHAASYQWSRSPAGPRPSGNTTPPRSGPPTYEHTEERERDRLHTHTHTEERETGYTHSHSEERETGYTHTHTVSVVHSRIFDPRGIHPLSLSPHPSSLPLSLSPSLPLPSLSPPSSPGRNGRVSTFSV